MADNVHFAAFEKHYEKLVKALPMDLMYPTLVSKGLLRDPELSEKIKAATTDSAKARVFLDSIRPGLQIGGVETFEKFLDAMAEYEMNTKKEEIKILLSRVRQDLPSPPNGKQVEQTGPALPPSLEVDLYKPKPVAKFSKSLNIDSAFTRMTSEIETILESKKFSKLRRACIQRINSLGSSLPKSLVPKIQQTHSLDEMLDVLAQSPYWNWFDTRLLQALVSASGSAEAEEWLESFKTTFYAEKITKLIPYVSIKPFKESTNLVEKFDKDPKNLTVSELLQHKYKLEYEVLDIDEGELVLSCIKTGCVELTWQLPQELVYRAYTSMKRKHDELSSLAVKSLVCEEADKHKGLPFLWRGQEVGEVGPIEPLPEHVKQESYSLPQGFQWVTLSSGDNLEVVNFMNKHRSTVNRVGFQFTITYPHTRSEWQFGIRTTNGKLVGVVFAFPVCISIGGVSVMCVHPGTCYHKNYRNKRVFYLLHKELQRRANLSSINQIYHFLPPCLLKPVTTITYWRYQFTHPTSAQLPNSPRTPGWRKMTSEDVPSALALVNKYSSQFEIRRVFTTEEEFSHNFLCPAVPNFVFTYVVENKSNDITDLVRCKMLPTDCADISIVVSTQSLVHNLITDAMVCVRENGAAQVRIPQFPIVDHVLSSLSFEFESYSTFCLYNYKYHQIHESNFWFIY